MSALSVRIGQGASRLPADIALSLIPSLPRATLERLAQRIIDHLDATDAQTEDMEDDDPAGMMDEDELTTGTGFAYSHGQLLDGAGCPISDPGGYAPGEGPRLPRPTYDGEDQSVVIVHAVNGCPPTTWNVS